MVEEIEYDTEIKCTHVLQKSCFQSYTTVFKNTKVCPFFKTAPKTCVQLMNVELSSKGSGMQGQFQKAVRDRVL